jgi:hypothetical protein
MTTPLVRSKPSPASSAGGVLGHDLEPVPRRDAVDVHDGFVDGVGDAAKLRRVTTFRDIDANERHGSTP